MVCGCQVILLNEDVMWWWWWFIWQLFMFHHTIANEFFYNFIRDYIATIQLCECFNLISERLRTQVASACAHQLVAILAFSSPPCSASFVVSRQFVCSGRRRDWKRRWSSASTPATLSMMRVYLLRVVSAAPEYARFIAESRDVQCRKFQIKIIEHHHHLRHSHHFKHFWCA